jgi:hypothetical protein
MFRVYGRMRIKTEISCVQLPFVNKNKNVEQCRDGNLPYNTTKEKHGMGRCDIVDS